MYFFTYALRHHFPQGCYCIPKKSTGKDQKAPQKTDLTINSVQESSPELSSICFGNFKNLAFLQTFLCSIIRRRRRVCRRRTRQPNTRALQLILQKGQYSEAKANIIILSLSCQRAGQGYVHPSLPAVPSRLQMKTKILCHTWSLLRN